MPALALPSLQAHSQMSTAIQSLLLKDVPFADEGQQCADLTYPTHRCLKPLSELLAAKGRSGRYERVERPLSVNFQELDQS